MATNTWKKIKNKFKWKKANSRSRKASRRKKKKNTANTANMISVPKRPKKKATKSNIFGCLTNVPKEYKQCNIEPNYRTYPTSTNSTVTTKSKSSDRNNSIQHTNQIICINNDNNNIDNDKNNNNNNNNNNIVPFRPISPSKTETSKKFIIDNVSNVSVSCLSNNAEIKYNMTPTPQTFTLTDNDYLYRNDIDIYEGVLEVENDTIIEEYAYGDAEYDYGYDFEQFEFEFDADKTSNNININNDSLIDLKQKRESVELELLINDKQFINQLNMELNEYGYDNPQQLLQQVWDQQIQIDRNHQIVEILECLNNNINVNNNNNNECMEETVETKETTEKEKKQEKVKEKVEEKEKEKGQEKENRKESDEDDDIICDGEIFHNKYMVGHKINEGGFGSVWQIIDNNLYSKCVKIMDLGDKNNYEAQIRRRKACVREYNMTLKAFSDEVIEVELFIDNIHFIQSPKAYLIMPYFNGKDLFEFIDDEDYFKKVSIQTMLHIFYKMAEKLYDLHYFKKIVHGDIKPENVMILKNNNNNSIEVEIIDYGIAKSIRNLSSDTTYLKSKGHFGTKGYVAPELMTYSKYNRKIDVFSSGVVLYNMVTECCLFPKGYKYYRLPQCDYYKYLKKKFKCIKKKKKIIDILYSCLAFDPDERLDVKQLIQRYFHSKS